MSIENLPLLSVLSLPSFFWLPLCLRNSLTWRPLTHLLLVESI